MSQSADASTPDPQDAGPGEETPLADFVDDLPEGEDAESSDADGASDLQRQLDERTLDLQRLQAEYVNYKRRVDRDRELAQARGEGKVLESLLTVLDDLGRAEEHGELTGGFKAVADALRQVVAKHGLEAFGAEGEPFDPALHEAVFQVGTSPDVEVTSIGQVLRIGYRHGDRVVRAATVGVVEPGEPTAESD